MSPSGKTQQAGAASGSAVAHPYLDVKDLAIFFDTDDGVVRAVNGVTFSLERGKTLGIVGESGSGKSVTSFGIMGLHSGKNTRITGEVWLDGQDLVKASAEEVRRLRGKKMAMIFQDPLSAMHPYYTVGWQIAEAYRVHNKVSRKAARARAVEMLDLVGIPNPSSRVDDFPHQFSGGMRQRAMIAMALCCDPALLIADEPTTALDVTVQAQILELMMKLQDDFNAAIMIITHDLGVVAQMADDILVMYAGRQVEGADADDIFYHAKHPYTHGLLGSIPRVDTPSDQPLISIPGTPPSLIDLPRGCSFHPRCPVKDQVGEACWTTLPELVDVRAADDTGPHIARCHFAAAGGYAPNRADATSQPDQPSPHHEGSKASQENEQ